MRERYKRVAQATLAACLLAVAFLALTASITHFGDSRPPYNPLWYENDRVLILGLVSFTSGLLATFMSALLNPPVRYIIFVGGGMMTLLSVVFWLGVAAPS